MNWLLDRKVSAGYSIFAGMSVVLLSVLAWVLHHLVADPKVVMLTSDGPAEWIRADEQFDLSARHEEATSAVFIQQVMIPASRASCNLQVAALRRVVVKLDGRQLFDSGPALEKWKTTYNVPIPMDVPAGPHSLQCRVSNRYGPSLLRLQCAELGISTDATWWASTDKFGLSHAALARTVWEPQNKTPFPSQAILWLGGLFAAGLFLCSRQSRTEKIVWPTRVRWLLLAAWFVLGFNNIFKVPLLCGFDATSHYDYILFIADHRSLPRPDGGWQYFQSPLYYIVSAAFCRFLLATNIDHNEILFLLRWIPLVCAAGIVEISYRAGRMVFPTRGGLQIITTVVGGLAPVNLYMAQTVSNEPMAGALSGLILLMILRFITRPQAARSSISLALAGAALGLAWLTKINTVLWALPLGIAIAVALRREKINLEGWIKAGAIVAGFTLLISGWLMIRNYRQVGKLFYLESSVAQSQWWQDPGYRTPSTLYEFGHVFLRPTHNVMASVWDSLYGTLWGTGVPSGQAPWHYGLMWCGLWLAIIPSLSIFLGTARVMFDRQSAPSSESLQIAVLTVGCFIAAILYVYITLPIYGCAKASYMMGTTPCLGLLAAMGFDWIKNYRWLGAIFNGLLICWAVTAYLTYFAII